jgi:exonuclease SbcD
MTTIIVAGNHDAAGRLEAPGPLLEAFNIRVIGNVHRRGGRIDGLRHLVPIPDATGSIALYVIAVSYPTAACLPNLTRLDSDAGSPVIAGVRSLYDELHETLRSQINGLPFVLTGHLHVAGGLESEGAERRILIGGQHAVPHDVFPLEASYVALGHLHRPQAIGRHAVRYSGSLFPLSATEQSYNHGVTLVMVDGAAVTTEHISIAHPVPYLRLPKAGHLQLSELGEHLAALDLPTDAPTDDQPFIQLHLMREALPPGFREEIDRIAESFPVRVVDVRVAALPNNIPDIVMSDPFVRLSDRDPEELFKLAFARQFGATPDAAHLDVFHRVRAEV